MSSVEIVGNSVSIEAALIAKDLGLEPDHVLEAMRSGRVTASCERGIAEDAGRLRVTFYHHDRRLRLIIDDAGRVLQRSVVRVRRRRHPPQVRQNR